MITITQTHQLTFRQLIPYIDDNPIFDTKFVGSYNSDIHVHVDSNRNILTQGSISFNDLFDVELTRNIDNDTQLETAISIYHDHSNNGIYSKTHNNISINTILESDNDTIETLSIHCIDDLYDLTKIWYREEV